MSNILDRLTLDHRRISKVLGQLAGVAHAAAEGEQVDIDRLYCMIDYLGEYPHKVHHPTEDIIFNALLDKPLESEDREVVQSNCAQHETLHGLTQALIDDIDAGALDVQDAVAHYIKTQGEHLKFEEDNIFPLAKRVFSEADWSALDARFEDTFHDPLFDAADHRYAALYECLGVEPEGLERRARAAVGKFLHATGGE